MPDVDNVADDARLVRDDGGWQVFCGDLLLGRVWRSPRKYWRTDRLIDTYRTRADAVDGLLRQAGR